MTKIAYFLEIAELLRFLSVCTGLLNLYFPHIVQVLLMHNLLFPTGPASWWPEGFVHFAWLGHSSTSWKAK